MSIKLSERDCEIIAHTCLQADVSVAGIAKQTGLREHTVRNSISRLTGHGVLDPVVPMNPYALGLTEYYVFFAIDNSPEAYEKTLAVLLASENVFWLSEIGSTYRFAASILSRGPSSLARILEDISAKLGNILKEKHVTICYSFYALTPRNFSSKKVAVPHLWYGDNDRSIPIDATDHLILRNLSKKPLITLRELSRKIDVAVSTLEYRIKNLRTKKIITGYEYYVDFQKIGLTLYPLALYLSKNTAEAKEKIIQFAKSSSNVTYLALLIGRWDAELGIVVRTPQEASTTISELYRILGSDLNRIEFYPAFSI